MDKLVYVKKLEKPTDKNGKTYTKITDQDNQTWAIFRAQIDFQVNKAYLITYDKNENGYPDIKAIKPLVNIMEEKALAKVADLNEYKKDVSVALRFAVDLQIAGKIEYNELYAKADELLKYINTTAQSLMPKEPAIPKFEEDKPKT